MFSLTHRSPQGPATPQALPLRKRLVTLGVDPGCDVVLTGPGIADVHAQLLKEGGGYTLATVNAKEPFQLKGEAQWRAALTPGDVFTFHGHSFTYSAASAEEGAEAEPGGALAREVFPRLVKFSERLAGDIEPGALFRTLLDQVIEVTGASKGFLVLIDETGKVTIPVARNIDAKDLNAGPDALSDSILQRAIETQRPVIVSDALQDARFSQAKSVVDLKLSSVMCAPLRFRGQLLGAIYLGNDTVTSLFTEDDLEVLAIYGGQAALILFNAQVVGGLKADNQNLMEALERSGMGRIIGQSPPMKAIFRTIERLADTDISILIQGETGTGKELIARELHARSARRDGPFVSINCGAIPEQLLESELFGHVKGAFTGALTHRVGRFESANGGTLFLDEIGEMPLPLQVKLLRVLQERTIQRLGEGSERPIDIRILSATNKDLEAMIPTGGFREDLFYRLNEVMVQVPPLRERGGDVDLLAQYYLDRYLARYAGGQARSFSQGALKAMRRYVWPGNVRQLENRIKKAVILGDRARISAEDLDIFLDKASMKIVPLKEAQDAFSLDYVRQVLEANNWNKSQTARDLDVDPRTIFRYAERMEEGAAGGDDTEEGS